MSFFKGAEFYLIDKKKGMFFASTESKNILLDDIAFNQNLCGSSLLKLAMLTSCVDLTPASCMIFLVMYKG